MKKNIITRVFIIAILSLTWWSCVEMDSHKHFIREGERVYTGKVDSLQVFSGRNRVLIKGLFISDPKITEARISWNGGSVTIPVNRTPGIDVLSHMIEDLEENNYNFEVVTYDNLGNKSLSSFIAGSVYGERYQATLNNRPINQAELFAGDLTSTVKFGQMDMSSGVFGVEMKYWDSDDEEHLLYFPLSESEVLMHDYHVGKEFQYRTLFKPEPTSIDTFYSDFTSITPNMVYLKNFRVPFAQKQRQGRWGVLADWVTNDAIRVHNGGNGGWDEWNGNIFNVETGWGAIPNGITNGKIYQTVTLSPGTYTFKANLRQVNGNNDTGNVGEGDQVYIVAGVGSEIPDVDVIETSSETLGYVRVLRSLHRDDFKVEFTLTENKQVSVGYATTQPGGQVHQRYPGTSAGRHCNIVSFEFFKHD